MARYFCRVIAALLLPALLCMAIPAAAEPPEKECPLTLTAPAAVLMEAETGAVIFEKNADQRRPAASVTKLMTLLILLEKLDRGEIGLRDAVTVSPGAAGQTGSQAFPDACAVYPPEDLLRSTIIAGANDSATAIAEYIAGSEERFAGMMNEKAAEHLLRQLHGSACGRAVYQRAGRVADRGGGLPLSPVFLVLLHLDGYVDPSFGAQNGIDQHQSARALLQGLRRAQDRLLYRGAAGAVGRADQSGAGDRKNKDIAERTGGGDTPGGHGAGGTIAGMARGLCEGLGKLVKTPFFL